MTWAVIATLACNVGYGVAHGWPGALLSGWPAVAFVVAAETAITMTRQRPAAAPVADTPLPQPPAGLNGHGHQAAELFAADLARGTVPGIRRIREEMHVGQPKAQQVRDYLAGLANGHGGR